jgi:FMN reductase (NADPH)
MNETFDVLLGHRSIRRYTDEPVPDEVVRAAVEAGRWASTSSLVQAYCAILVRDPDTLAQLSRIAGDQSKVRRAGAFLVICADTRRHRLAAREAGTPYETRLEGFLVAAIDAALFAQNTCVAFESLGYGICYVGGLRNDLPAVDRVLEIPDGIYPLFGLCVGRPAEAPEARPRLPLDAVLFDERYPSDEAMLELLAAHDEEVAAIRERQGRTPGTWSARVAVQLSRPTRTDLAAYYTAKGADLG